MGSVASVRWFVGLLLLVLLAGGLWYLLIGPSAAGDDPADFDDGPAPTAEEAARASLQGAVLEGTGAEAGPTAEGAVPEGQHGFRLRLVDAESGAPVADASVFGPNNASLATSDADGKVHFTHTARQLEIEIEAEGYVLARDRVMADSHRTIRLLPGVRVEGRLLIDGSPVAEATIHAWDVDLGDFAVRPVQTDRQGLFVLVGIRLNHPFEVIVTRDGHAPRSRVFTVSGDVRKIDVVLSRGGVFVVEVTDERGATLPDVPIHIVDHGAHVAPWKRVNERDRRFARDASPKGTRRSLLQARGFTDEKGLCRIQGIPLHRTFQAVGRRPGPVEVRHGGAAVTRDGEEQRVTLRFGGEGFLVVKLTNEDGESMTHARMRLLTTRTELLLDKPDEDSGRGVLTFRDLPAGSYRFIAQIENGSSYQTRVRIETARGAAIEGKLIKGLTLKGQLLDDGGAVVPGGTVRWAPKKPDQDAPVVVVDVDRRGRFEIRGVADVEGTLRARATRPPVGPRRYGTTEVEIKVPSQVEDLKLVLTRRSLLPGRIMTPLAGARLFVSQGHQAPQSTEVELDRGQRFSILQPTLASGVLYFHAEGFAPLRVTYGPEEPLQERLARGIELEKSHSLTIQIQGPKKPVAGARVTLVPPLPNVIWRSAADGTVHLEGLPSTPVRVRVLAPYRESVDQKVQVGLGSAPVIWVAEARYPVQGTVLRRGVFPRANTGVTFRGIGGQKASGETSTDVAGVFRTRLPEGRYLVRIKGVRMRPIVVTVYADRDNAMRIETW